MDNSNTLSILGKLDTEWRQTNKWKIKAKHNKQIKNQNETQYRKHNHIQFDVKPQKIGKCKKTKNKNKNKN